MSPAIRSGWNVSRLPVPTRLNKWISDHLCWTGVLGKNTHDLLPLPLTEETLMHVVERMKIIQDIPEFIGTDGKKYNLKKNDLISLQENMSNMLIKRKVAEKINR